MSRFVQPGTARIALTGGDWIEIRTLLTVGEQKRVDTSGLKKMSQGGGGQEFSVDFAEFSFARTLAYLMAWSFTDAAGVPVAITRASVEALTGDAYKEIEDAITAHVEAIAAAKKIPAGSTVSATS